jgi:ferric-dicitrate binding protein FerR (iron transport regulator)
MTKEILLKYLRGNCTEPELKEILQRLREDSPGTTAMFREVWDDYEPENGGDKVKYDRILDRIHHLVNIKENEKRENGDWKPEKRIQRRGKVQVFFSSLTHAAAILFVPVLTALLYTYMSDRPVNLKASDLEIVAPGGSRLQMELSDGTKVWLNHGSRLRYPSRFDGKNRKVYLKGEAFFEVAHNEKVPFIVETDRLEVKATGTEFNVSAYPDDKFVESSLVRGKVIVYGNDHELKALFPDESLKFDRTKNNFTIERGSAGKYSAWKDGLLIFKNDPVEEIAKKLSRWYNVEVVIQEDKAKEFTFTATFIDETLPEVLELMTLATPVSYKLSQRKKTADGGFTKQKVLIGLKNMNSK